MSHSFPLMNLSMELVLEIISFAAHPQLPLNTLSWARPSYSNARALASVSHLMYQITMPHLLHSVAFNRVDQLQAFIRSYTHQRRMVSSRLAVNYAALVRQFWATGIWEPLVGHDEGIDYRTLYDILRCVDCIGLSFPALHILYNSLASVSFEPSPGNWTCQRLILAGAGWRWSPLISTREGLAFLSQITHLALWIPCHTEEPAHNERSDHLYPQWLSGVPFSLMPGLTYFSFPLLTELYEGMVVQVGTNDEFREWVRTGGYTGKSIAVTFETLPFHPTVPKGVWDSAYIQTEVERVWRMGH